MERFLYVIFLLHFSSLFGGEKIELRPHQRQAVEYLEKNPEQKGILLDHSLGSGKTFVALTYTENHQNQDVYVVLPRFLKSNWLIQMRSLSIKNQNRYHLVSFQESYQLLKDKDLSKSILIVDEIHKLIDLIRSPDVQTSQEFSQLYFKLQSAQRIIALSATPIYNDPSDLAYIINFVSGKNLLPVNKDIFQQEYTKINHTNSVWRGYFLESSLISNTLPIITLGASFLLLPLNLVMLGPLAITIVPPLLRRKYPIPSIPFRLFDSEKLKAFTQKYISYFAAERSQEEGYPSHSIKVNKVDYNAEQTSFYFDFADMQLDTDQLKMIIRDYNKKLSKEYIQLNSLTFQENLARTPTVGREIGNFIFKNEAGTLIMPEKFKQILEYIEDEPGAIAVYSSYFMNGIKEFAKFLDTTPYAKQYAILDPDDPVEKQVKTVDNYNEAKVKILLIHPEITEGISLKGTRQFHILEPISNKALFEQIVGRTIRYQSHEHLPKEQRHVNVYQWVSEIGYQGILPSPVGLIRRRQWINKYSEVNDSSVTAGITSLDKNYYRKDYSPDHVSLEHMEQVSYSMEALTTLLGEFSIEGSGKI